MDKKYYPLQCEVCNKTFSGIAPAKQHFESLLHEKKVKAINRGGMSNSHFCDVCHIFCDTSQMLENHKASPRHIEMVKKSKQFLRSESDPMPSSVDQSKHMQFPRQTAFGNTQINHSNPHTVNKSGRGYDFDGTRGHCYICNLELTSHAHAKQHLNGAKHQKARQRHEIGLSGGREQISCNACDVVFTGLECAKQHFESDKHKKRTQHALDTTLLSRMPTVSSHSSHYSETSYMPTENLVHLDNQVGGGYNGASGINDASNNQGNLSPINQTPASKILPSNKTKFGNKQSSVGKTTEYVFDGNKGYCNICKIDLTSEAHANQHLLGQKHKKAAKMSQNFFGIAETSTPEQGWIPLSPNVRTGQEYEFHGATGYCHVCKIDLTSQQHADQHLSGQKHRKAVELSPGTLKQSINKNSYTSTLTLDDGSITCTVEGTVKWYTCKMCPCRVNSLEQLRIHKESPKHKLQVEKNSGSRQSLNIEVSHKNKVYSHVEGDRFDVNYLTQNETSLLGLDNLADELCMSLGNTPSVPISAEFIDVPTLPDKCMFTASESQADYCKETIPFIVSSGFPGPVDTSQNVWNDTFNRNIDYMPRNDMFSTGAEKKSFSDLNLAPTLDIASFNNDGQMHEETHVKTVSGISDNCVIYDRGVINERIEKKGEPHKSLIRFDTVKGIAPNVDTFGDQSDFSQHRALLTTAIPTQLSPQLGMPKPDTFGYDKETKNVENYCKKDVKTSPERIIEPEVTMETPIPIIPKFCMGGSEEGSLDIQDAAGGGRHKTAGSDMARVLKNRPQHVKSVGTSEVSSDSEDDEFVSCRSSFGNLGKLMEKFKELSYSDKEDPKTSIPASLNGPGLKSSLNFVDTTFSQLHTVNNPGKNVEAVKSPFPYHKFYCSTCDRPMNSEKAWNEHLRGRAHLQKVADEQAPKRNHMPIITKLNNYEDQSFELTNTFPRMYQAELFSKAMEKDSVCFLPTGTGKTLISCMVISAMLEHNSSRQVLFLVDKVLLVLQQAKYLKKELGDRIYKRFNTDDASKTVDRKLKIAELCSGQQSTKGVPLWKHDIIVITAAFCENLISRGIIKWEDQCLLVFDEAHHCMKNHPFNKLLVDLHQKKIPSPPKILGLTASPAGKKTLPMTVNMVGQLLLNMGGAKLVVVEKNQQELRKFQSNATISVSFQPMTEKEVSFKETLQLYLLWCYLRLAAETDINQQFGIEISAVQRQNLSEKDLKGVASGIVEDVLSLQDAIEMAHPKENTQAKRLMVDNLKQHTRHICMVLNVMFESGVFTAIEELQELSAGSFFSSFEFAESIGLPCQALIDQIETCMNIKWGKPEQSLSIVESSQFCNLLHELTSGIHIDWESQNVMALVLVKQRCTAKSICNQLKSNETILQKGLKVTWVVGHGSGSDEQGMSVAQQKRILEEIKAHKYQIVVATSVAEEGIDLPECELVISLNPPSTVTALVQMRGRARKRNSQFVVLCSNESEKAKLKELMLREENMIKACNFIVLSHNKQHTKEVE